jgi:hypothetical protein
MFGIVAGIGRLEIGFSYLGVEVFHKIQGIEEKLLCMNEYTKRGSQKIMVILLTMH